MTAVRPTAKLDIYDYQIFETTDMIHIIEVYLSSVTDPTAADISTEVNHNDGMISVEGRRYEMLDMEVLDDEAPHLRIYVKVLN